MCAQDDQPELERIFADAKLPVKWSCGRRYVGGFVGSKAMERKWDIACRVSSKAGITNAIVGAMLCDTRACRLLDVGS